MSRASLEAARGRAALTIPTRSKVTVVIGPPCSGKTTFVTAHRRPDDIVVDLDALAVALGSPESHGHPAHHLRVALDARESAVQSARQPGSHRTWIILTDRDQARRFGLLDADIHAMTTPLDVCEERARTLGRPERQIAAIREWRDE